MRRIRHTKRIRRSGRAVRKSITGFYARKGYSKKKARYIAGAVAHKEKRKKVLRRRYARFKRRLHAYNVKHRRHRR